MLIKIINGIYGLKVREGLVEPKTVNDAPFLVSDEEGARLIKLGVARQTAGETEKTEVAPVQPTATETVKDDVTNTGSRDVQQPKADVKYSENMKLDELKKIAVEAGASRAKVKNMRTKKEVIEVIEKKLNINASDDASALPQISAADFV